MYLELNEYTPDFDLMSDQLPINLQCVFVEQVRRARQVLKDRNTTGIEYALSSLDWMLQTGGQELEFQALEQSQGDQPTKLLTRINVLKVLMDEIDISEQAQFANATWPEYFSVLALALVAEATNVDLFPALPNVQYDSEATYQHGSVLAQGQVQRAIESMEAVCFAEYLIEVERLTNNEVKKELSSRGKKGRKKSLKPFDELYKVLLDAYEKNNYRELSNRKASQCLYLEFKDEIDAVIESDDPEHQIAKIIGQYKNGKYIPIS